MATDVGFLAGELKVVDEATAKNRIFFVSAKEVVTVRERQRKSEGAQKAKTDLGKGLADGWAARLMEFERWVVVGPCPVKCRRSVILQV